jgi:predicted DsbA family dithiol-disulfide isomerase
MASLIIRDFTDPACPFAFSAEPARLRLRWLYGDQIEWRPRMVVLSQSPDDYIEKGFTPERQVGALEAIKAKYGMPIDTRLRPRMMATVHACRAVVAARLHAPEHEQALLRRLRIRAMSGDLIDEPAVIARCASEAGIEPMLLFRAEADDPAVDAELGADMAAARAPSVAALALEHKLAPAAQLGFRYTCPSYEIERAGGNGWPRFDAPGFQPVEVYEAAIANLAPELDRRQAPESVAEVLAWAREPLASAEVAAICGIDRDEAERQLAEVASAEDGWWSLPPAAAGTIAA